MEKYTISKEDLKVTVIICAYTMERFGDTVEAIDSVIAQNLKPHELIVAVDHDKELFQRLKSELPNDMKIVLNEGIRGLSETRNVGIRAASGNLVAFIDDDAISEESWLENLTKPFYDPMVVAVGGRSVPLWLNGKRPYWFPEELDWIIGCTYKGLPLDGNMIRNVPGCNMAFRKTAFDKAGFFRSEIGGLKRTPRGGEEADFCLRIKQKIPKALIIYEENATIHHKVPSWRLNFKYLFQRSYNEGFYKRMVEKLSPTLLQRSLSTEDSYIRYLFFTSIPERLRRFYKKGELQKVGAILACVAATILGYLTGWVKLR